MWEQYELASTGLLGTSYVLAKLELTTTACVTMINDLLDEETERQGSAQLVAS